MTTWQTCRGSQHFFHLTVQPWRIVESQSTLTTRTLVDTSEEYDILEDMLESSKPQISKNTDYLIFTPFRYPPLKYGSRFGTRFERSLWYGSLDINTALTEVAYYRLLFLNHSHGDLNFIDITLTAFQALLKSEKAIDLCTKPFSQYESEFSDKNNYTYSQAIGNEMRSEGVEVFIYRSARSLELGKNLAAFTPDVFHKKNHKYAFNFQTWQCLANRDAIDFINQDLQKMSFTRSDFSSTQENQIDYNPEWVSN